MPILAERYYRMLAKVRPMLFWISRDNVGSARIGWRGDTGGARGFELLIGSDPARAPRRINRWGYIAEEVRGSRASVLGVMKQTNEGSTHEDSINAAEAQLGRETSRHVHVFKAIRATAANGEARADVLKLHFGNDLTYHDLDVLLTQLQASQGDPSPKTVALPAGTRPGFLVALADLIHESVHAQRQRGSRAPAIEPIPYVYNGQFHVLQLRHAKPIASMHLDGREFTTLLRGRFETESRTTGERTAFEITYGTTGSLAEVPIYIVYQPKWWFQVELLLEDDAARF